MFSFHLFVVVGCESLAFLNANQRSYIENQSECVCARPLIRNKNAHTHTNTTQFSKLNSYTCVCSYHLLDTAAVAAAAVTVVPPSPSPTTTSRSYHHRALAALHFVLLLLLLLLLLLSSFRYLYGHVSPSLSERSRALARHIATNNNNN